MKWWTLMLLCGAMLGAGCATSTVDKRKQERYGAYTGLTADQKSLVDRGEIKVGMTMDAVYIAWGKPSQILTEESSAGTTVRWLYPGTYLQGYSYWSHPGHFGPYHRYYFGPTLSHDYMVMNYVKAEVVFVGGVVKEWRTLPSPGR